MLLKVAKGKPILEHIALLESGFFSVKHGDWPPIVEHGMRRLHKCHKNQEICSPSHSHPHLIPMSISKEARSSIAACAQQRNPAQ